MKILILLLLLLHKISNNTGSRTDKSFCNPITLRVVWRLPLFDGLNQAALATEYPRLKIAVLVAE